MVVPAKMRTARHVSAALSGKVKAARAAGWNWQEPFADLSTVVREGLRSG
jgi:hypothetical protein